MGGDRENETGRRIKNSPRVKNSDRCTSTFKHNWALVELRIIILLQLQMPEMSDICAKWRLYFGGDSTWEPTEKHKTLYQVTMFLLVPEDLQLSLKTTHFISRSNCLDYLGCFGL